MVFKDLRKFYQKCESWINLIKMFLQSTAFPPQDVLLERCQLKDMLSVKKKGKHLKIIF